METLDEGNPDNIQIKAILLDQIKDHDDCQDELDEDYSSPPILEWPSAVGSVPVPDTHGAGLISTHLSIDPVGGFAEDDLEVGGSGTMRGRAKKNSSIFEFFLHNCAH